MTDSSIEQHLKKVFTEYGPSDEQGYRDAVEAFLNQNPRHSCTACARTLNGSAGCTPPAHLPTYPEVLRCEPCSKAGKKGCSWQFDPTVFKALDMYPALEQLYVEDRYRRYRAACTQRSNAIQFKECDASGKATRPKPYTRTYGRKKDYASQPSSDTVPSLVTAYLDTPTPALKSPINTTEDLDLAFRLECTLNTIKALDLPKPLLEEILATSLARGQALDKQLRILREQRALLSEESGENTSSASRSPSPASTAI